MRKPLRSALLVAAGFGVAYLAVSQGLTRIGREWAARRELEESARCERNAQVVRSLTPEDSAIARRELNELSDNFAMMVAREPANIEPAEPARANVPADWHRYARHTFSIPGRLVALPRTPLEGADLYRHASLNPKDTYVEERARDLLNVELASHVYLLQQITTAQDRTASMELNALIHAGLAASKPFDAMRVTTMAQQDFERHGHVPTILEQKGLSAEDSFIVDSWAFFDGRYPAFSMQFRGPDQKVYAARLREMPLTQEFVQIHNDAVLDIALVITEWAKSLRILDAGQAADLVERVTHLLTKNTG